MRSRRFQTGFVARLDERLPSAACILFLIVASTSIAFVALGLYGRDFTVPWVYNGGDDVWQLVLTKMLRDTGWVLYNPYLGAPDIASWHHNAAAQTSALHSVLMRILSLFINDAVAIQQVYYVINFPLIAVTSFLACRLIGISRLPAICVALIMAFTNYRITESLYSFLPNYFMVPLGLVPIYWIISGRFELLEHKGSGILQNLKSLVFSKDFGLGVVIICLLATSDGYYAFFELLLMGFAFISRLFTRGRGYWDIVVPVVYAVIIVGVSLLLAAPLKNYERNHPDEFAPGGVTDPTLIKHPFEAEVYSTTLKMLLTPQPDNRIPFIASIGRKIIATSDDARLYKNGRTMVPLNLVGSILFLVALMFLTLPSVHDRLIRRLEPVDPNQAIRMFNSFLSVSMFIFLCSILGGLGTIVALVFPTIRAYDRFPLFLIFTLFSAAGFIVTLALRRLSVAKRAFAACCLLLITAVALLDQIPGVPRTTPDGTDQKFLAERRFVQKIESDVPPSSMIYQYPHSQYLENSPYYGWGSFAHVRLYLHSKALRWSNGASKNSPVETWHLRVSNLPFDQMINEIQAAGFAGIVIDRSVVPAIEFDEIASVLAKHGARVLDDPSSRLAFSKLPESGFHLQYDEKFHQADAMIVTDRRKVKVEELPPQLDQRTVSHWLEVAYPGQSSFSVKRAEHPDVFVDAQLIDQGSGIAPVVPLPAMTGTVSCNLSEDKSNVEVAVENASSFDWVLRSGPFPLSLGFHIRSTKGEMIRFDNGARFPVQDLDVVKGNLRTPKFVIPRGGRRVFSIPVSGLSLVGLSGDKMVAEFGLVQDGNAWFNHLKCAVEL